MALPSIAINTGEVRLSINDDPTNVISFNPADANFAERFYKIVSEFEAKLKEYESQASVLSIAGDGEQIALLKETCEFVREKIDYVFGAGTSQKVFGDALVLDVFSQFFDGIMPYIQKARTDKVGKYIVPVKVSKHRKRK